MKSMQVLVEKKMEKNNGAVPILEDSSIPLRRTQNVMEGKTSEKNIKIRTIKKLYDAITERKVISVLAIRWLEHLPGY